VNYLAQTAAVRAFDAMADTYDDVFTFSPIGRAQREQVWRVADQLFLPGMNILELNCGTGEDAIHFGQRGVHVTAIDASSRMIARARVRASGLNLPIQFSCLSSELLTAVRPRVFDGIFSNFSGLNCVRDLYQVARSMSFLLAPGSSALLCLSTRFCFWESAWYGVRGQFAKASRRWNGRNVVRVCDSEVEVWYPTIREFQNAFEPWFRLCDVSGVGIFVPPSYLNGHFRLGGRILESFADVDRLVCRLPLFRVIGDHMLLRLERTDA
jgi:SAM-dependent methyltransferase